MRLLLQLATGVSSSDKIDLERIAEVAAGLKHNDWRTRQEFQDRLQKSVASKQKFMDLTSGRKTKVFDKLVKELCNPYRAGMERDYWFREEFKRLTKLKRQEKNW